MQPLISVDDLRSLLDANPARTDVCIVDARFSLADPGEGRRGYDASHLPGAVYLHLDHDLSGPLGRHGGRHPLPEPDVAAATFGAVGIGPETHVVAYDAGDGMTAVRVWWLLRWLGHERVQVLDGGLAAWRAAGAPETAAVPTPSARPFTPQPRAEMVVDRDWVLAHLDDPDVLIVDARAAERYRGDVEPIDPRAGHVPGAINLPFAGNLSDGRFRRAAELRERFASLADAKQVVVYCGSGVSAAHDLLALELAGMSGATLYAGSWSDWVSYPDAPVALGAGRRGEFD